MTRWICGTLAGVIFALGLALSGMTQPEKVIGFLDVTGAWDPSLAFVMVGAIGVHGVLVRLIGKRPRPVFAGEFVTPPSTAVDRRLLLGAALFGLGWGIAGYCPGPALVATSALPAAVFVVCMVVGVALHRRLPR